MKRNYLVLFLILASLALMFWAGWANFETRRQQAARIQAQHVALEPEAENAYVSPLQGKPAPEFTLNDLSGKKVSLADYKGKAVLLELLGNLVRAVQGGDSLVPEVARAIRRAGI